MENIRNHNNMVESRMIAHELSKFKMDIRKLSAKSGAVSPKYEDSLESCDEDSEETKLLQALRESEDATFAYKNDSNNIVVEKKKSKDQCREFSCEEGSGFSGSTIAISESSQEKAVHFETDFIKVSAQPKPGKCKDFQEYYDITEDYSKFNVDDDMDTGHKTYDDCFMCCNDDDCQFAQFESRSYDVHSFYSLPNLNDGDIENLMKITKFQSMMTVETTTVQDYSCCLVTDLDQKDEKKIQYLDKSIEEAETEKMLIVRRMEIEEKNYQELVIMSHAHSKNISDPQAFECEKIINDLFMENQQNKENQAEKELLKICFKDWLQKTTVAKILKTNAFTNEDRVKKINCFLNKIRLEQNKGAAVKSKKNAIKTKPTPTTTKSSGKVMKKDFEHKMKVQQDIIELQKLKIQRQERMITEMKLAKFSEMMKESKNDLKMELINAKRGNTKLRVKARCIQIAANIKPDPEEEEKRKLLAQGLMVPKFLQKMQERAFERLARHEEARERRERLENDKEEMKTAAELARRLEDEEAKQKRYLEMREKRRQEKMAKVLKEQERQRYQESIKLAKEHYARSLMKQLGFKAFQYLIRLKRTNHKKATIHRRKMCMKKSFQLWFINAKIVWDNKRAQADRLYELSLMRSQVKVWKHIHNINKSKFLVAIDWYEVKISEKLFKRWIKFSQRSKFVESTKMKAAEAHYNWYE